MIKVADFCWKYPVFPILWLALGILMLREDKWFGGILLFIAGMEWHQYATRDDIPKLSKIDIVDGSVEDTFRGVAQRVFTGDIHVQTVRWAKNNAEGVTNIEIDLAYPDNKRMMDGTDSN